jgi:hypothetical protein
MTNEWDDESVEEEDEDDSLGPGRADNDLSEEHGYTWEPARTEVIPQWVMLSVSLLVVIALVAPTVYLIWRYG